VTSSSAFRTLAQAMCAPFLSNHWNSGSDSMRLSETKSKVLAGPPSRTQPRRGATARKAGSARQRQSHPHSGSFPGRATAEASKPASRSARAVAIPLILAGLFVLSSEALFAQTSPSAMLDQYRSVRGTWLFTAAVYANRLFGILALIEFAWTGAILVLERTDLQAWTAALIRKMMFIGAYFALLNFGADWIPRIIDSFQILGQNASGLPSLAPTDVLVRGLNIAGILLAGAADSGWMGTFGTALALVFAALLAFLAFLGLAIQLVVTLVESYLVVGAGFIFLGFGGSRWTTPYVERYIAFAVSIGVKVMVLYLLLGAGLTMTATWEAAATAVPTSASPAVDALDIAGSAVILLMICWNAPKLAASMLGGSPSFTGGDAVHTAGGLAQGALLVGAAGAGAVALGSRMLASRAGATGLSQAASMGSTQGSSFSAGFGGGGGFGGGAASSAAPAPHPPGGGSGGGSAMPDSATEQVRPPAAPEGAAPKSGDTSGASPSGPDIRESSPPASSGSVQGSGNAGTTGTSNQISRKLAVGTQFVRMARSAVPPDHAPHSTPPALRSDGEE
jgi:type IV secretion system protein TrbL